MSELQGLQRSIHEIRELDGEVLAISVDPPETSREVVERLGLDYDILSDPGARVIEQYGVLHVDGGLDGDVARPAGFILDRDGQVVWRELTENWRIRLRPDRVLEQLAAIP